MSSKILPPEERVINHTQFKTIKEDIRRQMKLSIRAGEPMCVALEGCTGAGKSTLVEALKRDLEEEEGPTMKIFYMVTPSDVTVKGMCSGMLYRLGDPLFEKGSRTTLDTRLQEFLRNQGVKLVILDDIQHMITNGYKGPGRRNESVSEWLKVLIKELGIPFLIVSTENSIENLLRQSDQLSRLFVTKHVLKPLPFSTAEEQEEFYKFVVFYLEGLGSSFAESITDVELAEIIYKIHSVTNGLPNKVTKLLVMAADYAREDGSEGVLVRHLGMTSQARLFEQRDDDGKLLETNPFIQDLKDSSGK